MNNELLIILQKNENYKENELIKLIDKHKNIKKALEEYKKRLFEDIKVRDDNIENITKENIEKYFLQPLNNEDYEYITQGIKQNKWTLKELLQKCQETGFNIFCMVGTKNKRAF